jgi:hypothetical protein
MLSSEVECAIFRLCMVTYYRDQELLDSLKLLSEGDIHFTNAPVYRHLEPMPLKHHMDSTDVDSDLR